VTLNYFWLPHVDSAGASPVELRRFLRKVNGDLPTARANYASHVQWRQETSQASAGNVPRWMWFDEQAQQRDASDSNGHVRNDTLLLWVQGAMFNSSAATVDEYVLATTRTLDSALDRAADDKTQVFVDTAAFKGMNNEPASRIVRYATSVASTLNKHYPGRCHAIPRIPRITSRVPPSTCRVF